MNESTQALAAAPAAPLHRIAARRDPGAPVTHAAFCTPTAFTYFGGPVVQNMKIYNVNWGTNIAATVQATMPTFYGDVVQSAWWDWLSEYNTVGVAPNGGGTGTSQGISRGSFGGSVTIKPSVCAGTAACSLSDAQIQAELQAQIASGALPKPTTGCDGQNNTLYMINFHAAVAITDPNGNLSCQGGGFCAYHGTMNVGSQMVTYGVMPDQTNAGPAGAGDCTSGCGTNARLIDNATMVASHEIAETGTDPAVGLATVVGPPIGWYDQSCGEIGDICNQQAGSIVGAHGTWSVQALWSNAAHDCITTKATLPPICTSPGQTGCRLCACSDNNEGAPGQVGCSGAAPWCETTSSNIKFAECVQCVTDGECGSKTCVKSTNPATDDTCGAATCGTTGLACCLPGNTCTAPDVCTGGKCACIPATSCPAGENCGTVSDGCGGTINCGTCHTPQTCGGGGTANQCGCIPATSCPAGENCGTGPDGCGGTIACGTCQAPQTCGGGGTANQCGCAAATSCPAGQNCGTAPDGCGGTIACGACQAPQTCGGGGTANQCGCTKATSCPAGQTCNTAPDGCGGTIACGTCQAPQTCGGGGAANQCGCAATTCTAQGAACGSIPDTCGGSLSCGDCPGGQTCTSNKCVAAQPDGGGPVPDGGTPPDSGSGALDSGASPGDAGSSADAGSGPPGTGGGCGCRIVPTQGHDSSLPLAGFGGLAMLGLRRLRRRSAQARARA